MMGGVEPDPELDLATLPGVDVTKCYTYLVCLSSVVAAQCNGVWNFVGSESSVEVEEVRCR